MDSLPGALQVGLQKEACPKLRGCTTHACTLKAGIEPPWERMNESPRLSASGPVFLQLMDDASRLRQIPRVDL